MEEWLSREILLLGKERVDFLSEQKVAVIGLGGVGCAAAEALCRAGVGHLFLQDGDVFDFSNLNRQIFSTRAAVGKPKVEVALERIHAVSPGCNCTILKEVYSPNQHNSVFDFQPDYIIDAIDTITAKVDLQLAAGKQGIPLVASMGTGNRIHPELLTVGDLSETKGWGCGLSRAMRRLLRPHGMEHARVVYSKEPPWDGVANPSPKGRHAPGSISFVPPVAGYLLAGEVIRSLLNLNHR